MENYPTYPINAIELDGIYMRLGNDLQGPIIMEVNDEPREETRKEPSFHSQTKAKGDNIDITWSSELCNINIKVLVLLDIKDILIHNKIL